MRYLVSGLLILPFLSSCSVADQHHYHRGYYVPAPRVEVQPYDANRHYHENSRNRVYYNNGSNVVIHPRPVHVAVPRNNHGHVNNSVSLHGHSGVSGNVHGPVNNTNTHGHNPKSGAVVVPPWANGAIHHSKSDNRQAKQGAIERQQPHNRIPSKAHGHG